MPMPMLVQAVPGATGTGHLLWLAAMCVLPAQNVHMHMYMNILKTLGQKVRTYMYMYIYILRVI
jgi:hypothetical protein